MANWSGGLLTTKGQALQAKVDAGQTELLITKMKIGSGTADSLQNLTDLVEPQQNIAISGITAADNLTTITGVITNAGLTEGFYVRELGVYATDPDDGEILYSVTADSAPDYLPAEGDSVTVSQEFNYYIAVSNASNVSATLSTSGLVTTGMLQTHTHDGTGSNGPQITSAGLASDSVTDTKIGNRTITDTVTAVTGANTLTNLLSMLGNMIKKITGKSAWYTAPATTLEAANTHITATSGAHIASAISSTATGDVAATNVQAAIAELASSKAALSGADFTGVVHVTAGVASAANAINWNTRLSSLVTGSGGYSGIGTGVLLDCYTNNSLSQPIAGIASHLSNGGTGSGSSTDYAGGLMFYTKDTSETFPTKKIFINNAGWMGVNNFAPSYSVDVVGNINASTGLYINGVAVSTVTAPGSAPLYACRAWVSFDGTTATPTINASGNVSSVVKNSTGNYTINFTTAMPSADYATFGSIVNTSYTDWFFHPSTKTVNSFTCNFTHGSSAGDGIINLAIIC